MALIPFLKHSDHGQGGYRVTINGNEMASGGEFGKEEIRVFGSCTEPAPPHTTPRPTRTPPTTQPTFAKPHVPGEKGVIKFEMYKVSKKPMSYATCPCVLRIVLFPRATP